MTPKFQGELSWVDKPAVLCEACGDLVCSRDEATKLCRPCWRVAVLSQGSGWLAKKDAEDQWASYMAMPCPVCHLPNGDHNGEHAEVTRRHILWQESGPGYERRDWEGNAP